MKTTSLSTLQTILTQTSPVMITTALRKRPVKENEMTFFYVLSNEIKLMKKIMEIQKETSMQNI